MAVPPNIANYTIPGGVKVFFDDGTGERDLGNIKDVELQPSTDELEHFSNRSGKRARDHAIIIEEALTVKGVLDEPVIENWKYFLRGGATTVNGAGSVTLTDHKVTLSGINYMSVGQYYGLSAVTVRQFLDYCLLFDGVSTYTNNSVEADSAGGTPFSAMADANDKLYLGKLTPFKEVYVDVQAAGNYGARTWEYWNGTTWTAVVPTGVGEDFAADGKIVFGTMAGFALTTVNSISAYWVRCSVASVTGAATINSFRQNAVVNTDYSLDVGVAGADGRLPGRIGRIAAGILEDGEEVKVTFTYTTWTSQQFNIAGGAYAEGSVRLEVHPSTGRGISFDIEIPRAQLKADGAIPFNDREWMGLPVLFEVMDDTQNTPTYPMGRFVIYES